MAAYNDSLATSEGQTWSLFAESIGFKSPNSDQGDDSKDNKINEDSTSMLLRHSDMPMYGYCPRWEELYLVICNQCGKALKPQSLKHHIELRHKDHDNHNIKEDECDSRSSMKTSKRYKIDEESSTSPLDYLTHDNELNMDPLSYNSLIDGECNTLVGNSSSVNSNASDINSACDFMTMTDDVNSLPLLKINLKDSYEDSFLSSRLPPTSTYPSNLPPPAPPDVQQHILPLSSPHSGHPSNIGSSLGNMNMSLTRRPSTPQIAPLTPGIGPPTPGMGPLTPNMGPPTPGSNTPIMGPMTPIGPLTPVMAPLTPGMGPPTPGMGPPTPGPQTPGANMGPHTPNMGPLTPSMSPQLGSNSGIILQNVMIGGHVNSQNQNMCPLTPTYVPQTIAPPHTPVHVQSHIVSPMTPSNIIPQSPNLEHTVPNMNSQPTGYSSLTPSPNVQMTSTGQFIHQQTVRINTPSPSINSPAVSQDINSAHQIPEGSGTILHDALRGSKSLPQYKLDDEASAVNRISAMLMKEAEALSSKSRFNENLSSNAYSQTNNRVEVHGLINNRVEARSLPNNKVEAHGLPNRVEAHGLPNNRVEAHGLPSKNNVHSSRSHWIGVESNNISRIRRISSPNIGGQYNSPNISVSQPLSSVPVSMSSMSMATLKQIQADLLNTVSESDLNAVLNATPDTNTSDNSLNSFNNVQYSVKSSATSISAHSSSSIQNLTNNKTISSSQIKSNNYYVKPEKSAILFNKSGHLMQGNDNQSLASNSESFQPQHMTGEKGSQCDELTRAINSITKVCQDKNNQSESQLGLVRLLQQPINTFNGSSQRSSVSAQNTQGITVLIGGGQGSGTPVSLSSIAGTLKKNPNIATSNIITHINAQNIVASPVHGILPVELCQSPNQYATPKVSSVSQKPGIAHPVQVKPQYQMSQVSNTQILNQSQPQYVGSHMYQQVKNNQGQLQQSPQNVTLIPPPTPSPKRNINKKKKPGDRKLLPLKDREYDPDLHCGVVTIETGRPCTRSLTCKSHSLTLRRSVQGRSKKFDELLNEHKASKDGHNRASKTPESVTNYVQSTPPRVAGVLIGSNGQETSVSNSFLARTLVGGIIHPSQSMPNFLSPSPTSSTHSYQSFEAATCSSSSISPNYFNPQNRIQIPSLSHRENYCTKEPPKPFATCTYNARKLGGYLTTDHKVDSLRSAVAHSLKKPHSVTSLNNTSIMNNLSSYSNQNNDRFSNTVKPLLAKKLHTTLQATHPANINSNKDPVHVTLGYNGQIQLNSTCGLSLANTALAAPLKRPTQPEIIKYNPPVASSRGKSKKVKPNENNTVSYVRNLVQLDPNSNKNAFPVVAVSLQNGLTNAQTITFGNVPIAGVRTAATNQLRLHPLITVESQTPNDVRSQAVETSNIVLGSNIAGGSFNFESLKGVKNDASGIRLDASKFIASKAGTSTVAPNVNLISSVDAMSALNVAPTVSNSGMAQGQVYFTAVNNNSQLLQQLLNCKIGKNTGVKFINPQVSVTSTNRPTYVLQQSEKELS